MKIRSNTEKPSVGQDDGVKLTKEGNPNIYFDQEWQDRDGKGWNVEFNDAEVVYRFATEEEAQTFIANIK